MQKNGQGTEKTEIVPKDYKYYIYQCSMFNAHKIKKNIKKVKFCFRFSVAWNPVGDMVHILDGNP